MRVLLIVSTAALLWAGSPASLGLAQFPNLKLETQQVKARQKQERTALRQQQQYRRQSLKGQNLPKAVRLQIKHEMDREARALREQQRNQLQELRDRQRLTKASANAS